MATLETTPSTKAIDTAQSSNHNLIFRRAPADVEQSGLSAEEMAKYIRQRVEFDRMIAQEQPKFGAFRRT